MIRPILRSVASWQPGAYARDGLRLFGWLLLRAVAQAITVLLLARWLGPTDYGVFVAALAIASFFTPLAGLGLGGVLLIRGARTPAHLPLLQRRAATAWAVASVLVLPLALLAMATSLPAAQPLWALALLALAEVAAASWVELCARSAQAQHQAHRFGAIQAGLPLARLAALLAVLPWAAPTPAVWMAAYAAASLLYAAALAAAAHWPRLAGPPDGTLPATAALVQEGLPFAGGAVAMRLQAEFNKPVLAHLSYAQAGAFAVAQRVIDLATLPLAALQEALWPRLFAAAAPNARLVRTGALLLLLALAAGLALALAAPLLPALLGTGYAAAADALVLLALLPALQLVRNLGNAWLIANVSNAALYVVYTASAAAGVLLALLLVPRWGLDGAVWTMYGSEGSSIAVAGIVAISRRGKTSR
ncbi:Polysaccharide biosynthesis protein [Tepidimonas thermarum]|uniref:Polysaccharide biosynthesis protein n=1 Tax=Tepidimonas thermarum TaxID=335431 RepID=A0A554X1L2_9BURK|nr:oligosaccharide flippase family protein [Tepidimonas thermarum]TSE29698.1 Polysaccharide biosynthesis protein [Tepidimonas thermarum]